MPLQPSLSIWGNSGISGPGLRASRECLTEVIRYLDSAIEILKNQQQVAICGFDMNLPPDKKLPA
jgi:hypothetical protein